MNLNPFEKLILRVGIAWLAMFLFVVAAIVGHNLARAAAQADCQSVPWGFLGSQTRTLCDTPLAPDGSWTRRRTIWVPAHQVPIVTPLLRRVLQFVVLNDGRRVRR